jgi:hypothetical protein
VIKVGTILDQRDHVGARGDGEIERTGVSVLLHCERLGNLLAVRKLRLGLP